MTYRYPPWATRIRVRQACCVAPRENHLAGRRCAVRGAERRACRSETGVPSRRRPQNSSAEIATSAVRTSLGFRLFGNPEHQG